MSDTTIEDDAVISVSLLADTPNQDGTIDYTILPSRGPVEVQVYDDDSLPRVSIVADSGNAPESNGTALFKLTATGLSAEATLQINATPAEVSGDYLTDAVADAAADFDVVFTDPDGDGTFTGELSVTLDDDETGEATGDLKLTLNADPDADATYLLGNVVEGFITILDDDAPELNIANGDPITEAEDAVATFTISAKISPDRPVTIYYSVLETSPNNGDGDFIADDEEGDKSIVFDFSSSVPQVLILLFH